MSVRTDLIADIEAHLPHARGPRVIGYEPDGVTAPTLLVWVESITRPEQFGLHLLQFDFSLWLLVGTEDPEKAMDQLDDALMDVIGALQQIGSLTWSNAEHGTYKNVWTGYKLTVTKVAQILDEES
jgi:hypothetical protein